jgi:hypothetical protein
MELPMNIVRIAEHPLWDTIVIPAGSKGPRHLFARPMGQTDAGERGLATRWTTNLMESGRTRNGCAFATNAVEWDVWAVDPGVERSEVAPFLRSAVWSWFFLQTVVSGTPMTKSVIEATLQRRAPTGDDLAQLETELTTPRQLYVADAALGFTGKHVY